MSETQTAPVAEQGALLRGAALATAGIAAAGLLAARPALAATYAPATIYFTTSPGAGAVQVPNTSKNFTTGNQDVRVLNYALTLETLEAELYRQAVLRLTTGGPDQFGNNIPGLGLSTSELDVKAIMEFALVETQHRNTLTAVLGNNWVLDAKAQFDFGFATTNNFGTAPPDRKATVEAVYGAELTGVTAYLGGAGQLATKTYLQVAAAILGVEARHTTFLAAILNGPPFSDGIATAPLATPQDNQGKDSALTPDQVLYQNATIAYPDGTVPPGGLIPAKTGKNGVGGKGFVFLPM